ncbi:MAG TPA: outer membrane beta-barrel protein [Cellvibrio sp.]|nr:outer membrane beta-barrel protein [Cellvibrio sp.]
MFAKKIMTALCLSIISLGAAADADNQGWFVGGKIGQVDAHTKYTIDRDFTYSENETAGWFAIYGGYNFSEWFGLEGNVFATDNLADGARDEDTTASDARYSGLAITPKFTWQVSPDFSLFAKGGMTFLSYKKEYRSHGYWDYNYDYSWDGIVLTYGVGAQINVGHGVVFRLGFDVTKGSLDREDEDRYEPISLDFDVDAKLKQTSLGVHYQF